MDRAILVARPCGGDRASVLQWVEVDVDALATQRLTVTLLQHRLDVERFLQVEHREAGPVGEREAVHVGLERAGLGDLQSRVREHREQVGDTLVLVAVAIIVLPRVVLHGDARLTSEHT